jgi:putative membrane protein
MSRLPITVAAAVLAFATGQVRAQPLDPSDAHFLKEAAAAGQGDVMLGRLAEKSATSPAVKSFGQQTADDHIQTNRALEQIAQQQRVALPTTPDARDSALDAQLSRIKGHRFDETLMRDMVANQEKDTADFRQEASSGADPRLKAFAQRYLPMQEQHLQMAESVAQAIARSPETQ